MLWLPWAGGTKTLSWGVSWIHLPGPGGCQSGCAHYAASPTTPPHLSGQHSDDPLVPHARRGHHVSFTLGSGLVEQLLWVVTQLAAEGKVVCWGTCCLRKPLSEPVSATATIFLCHVAMPHANGQGRAILPREARIPRTTAHHRRVALFYVNSVPSGMQAGVSSAQHHGEQVFLRRVFSP